MYSLYYGAAGKFITFWWITYSAVALHYLHHLLIHFLLDTFFLFLILKLRLMNPLRRFPTGPHFRKHCYISLFSCSVCKKMIVIPFLMLENIKACLFQCYYSNYADNNEWRLPVCIFLKGIFALAKELKVNVDNVTPLMFKYCRIDADEGPSTNFRASYFIFVQWE